MAVKDSREVVIEASPEEIFDVLADIESIPDWSPQYQSAEVLDTHNNGRPRRVRIRIKAAGITDDLLVGDAGQLKAQDAKYTLTPQGATTKVRFDMDVDPSIPIPGFLLKSSLKGGMKTATDGLRTQVLKLKKSR